MNSRKEITRIHSIDHINGNHVLQEQQFLSKITRHVKYSIEIKSNAFSSILTIKSNHINAFNHIFSPVSNNNMNKNR